MRHLPEGTCLQCEQTRDEVRREHTICGIEGGYEYRELIEQWDRHHWRDWSDAELRTFGIREERWADIRRLILADLDWVAVEERCARDGHTPPDDLDASGRCATCFSLIPQIATAVEAR
ncbi:hypothetical protein [Leifsonia sp. Leaf264]|uniref:hypothetical protein n=1 Tax=Leifsonia sp. Leaf264 TaxID=1736314 RepID=UPI0007022F43|nr:hypothetical protein [Leifsonia sp. Leaf264]KQO98571.1 hypothetical protein ASF30_10950 [Leifsonia sp. Leaf264]